MTATTRSTECNPETGTLYLAFELGSTKWTLGFTHAPAQRPRVRTIPAGDLHALEQEVLNAKARFGVPLEGQVRSCYEAGRDGFWLHRWLLDHGVANVVVDSSSIEVNLHLPTLRRRDLMGSLTSTQFHELLTVLDNVRASAISA